jgi:exodeoxyribonuclease VII large subunit
VTEGHVLSVSQYLQIVNTVLREHVPSQEIVVEGELTGYQLKDGKWHIFSLKDEHEPNTKVACFGTIYKVTGTFEDGMRVRVFGFPCVKNWSNFQIDVQQMEPVGEGALKKAYEALKKKLTAEGLFDAGRKRALPRFPARIGLVTSRDAAAYGDFLRILNNRWGGVEVDFVHVHVQGKEAVEEILSAFAHFNSLGEEQRPDVLVLTRGGGSLEDLHAFNDERVARAVFGSRIPVVCGVGHERDESLAEYAADVRASTPSNAAERIVPDRRDVRFEIDMSLQQMETRLADVLGRRRMVVERATRVIGSLVERHRERAQSINARFVRSVDAWLPRLSDRLTAQEKVLRQLDPGRVLGRGYAIVHLGGHVVKDPSQLVAGAEVGVQLAGGTFDAEVLRTNGTGKQKLI